MDMGKNMKNFEKILIISPHTDDGEVAAGGTLARFVEENKEIYYVAFSYCEISVPPGFKKDTLKNECKNATKIIGISPERVTLFNYTVRTFPMHRQKILDDMIKIRDKIKPDVVMVPSSHDTHQDHQTISQEALRAFKKTSSIWGFEHPWNNLTFTNDIFIKLEERHIQRKIESLKMYTSQEKRTYFEENYVKSLARTRGVQVDFQYAESFELIRMLLF